MTGRSVTAILHLFNKTPVDWYSKKQDTVQTATFGSEFISARTACDQIIADRIMLRYLGVPVKGPTFLFGDNKAVVESGSFPTSRLHKRHIALSFHKVREVIASQAVVYSWVDGKDNPADILSKHWGYQQVWPLLRPLLFWEGNTMDIPEDNGGESP
jgi:hypothetical protein